MTETGQAMIFEWASIFSFLTMALTSEKDWVSSWLDSWVNTSSAKLMLLNSRMSWKVVEYLNCPELLPPESESSLKNWKHMAMKQMPMFHSKFLSFLSFGR